MERKIGEIFEYKGEWYQCVGGTCRNCSCYYDSVCKNITTIGSTNFGNCHCSLRTDHKSVIFKKLEKVGEPFSTQYNGRRLIIQKYKLENKLAILPDSHWITFDGDSQGCIINIEIKQNKEDMEENKLNLKPFDIQKAREGKPVCTRDGRKARIICFDAKGDKPIIALVEMGTAETPNNYPIDGKAVSAKEASCDLMMLPEKKEGYVNLYHNCNDRYAAYLGNKVIYKDKEFAEDMGRGNINYIKTVKVQWEE